APGPARLAGGGSGPGDRRQSRPALSRRNGIRRRDGGRAAARAGARAPPADAHRTRPGPVLAGRGGVAGAGAAGVASASAVRPKPNASRAPTGQKNTPLPSSAPTNPSQGDASQMTTVTAAKPDATPR